MMRRKFLGTCVLVPVAATLAACTTTDGVTTIDTTTFANDVTLINGGLSEIASAPSVAPLVSPAITAVLTDANTIAGKVSALGPTVEIADAQNLISSLVSDGNKVLGLLPANDVPDDIAPYVQATQTLLSLVQVAVSLIGATPKAGSMPPSDARRILTILRSLKK